MRDSAGWKRGFALVCALVLLVGVAPLYAISFYNHPYYDDYGFSSSVHHAWVDTGSLTATLQAAAQSARHTRQTWQGTYTGTIFSNLQPGLFSESLYWIGNVFIITALIVSFVYFFCTAFGLLGLGREERFSLSCLALTLIIQFMPDVGEAFYWFNGGIGNTFIYSLLALAAGLSLKLIHRRGRLAVQLPAMLLLMVFLGGGSYGGGLFGLSLFFCLLVWLFVKKHGRRWLFAAMFAVFAACFLYSMAAPGNTVRAGEINYDSSAVKAVAQAMYYGIAQIGLYIRLPLLGVTLLLAPALYNAAKASPYRFSHPWLVLGLGVCLYCTQLAPPLYSGVFIGGGRIVNTYFISFVTLWFLYAYYLLGWIARKAGAELQLDARRMKALLLASLCMAGVGCMGYRRDSDTHAGLHNMAGVSAMRSIVTGEAAQYDREMTAREVLFNDDTLSVITISPLTANPDVFMKDLLHVGAVYDPRPSLRTYYRKYMILLEGEADVQ